MEGLLIGLLAWWMLSHFFRPVSSPFKVLPRVLNPLWRGTTHLLYHRQAKRRGAIFGLLHAFCIVAIVYTVLMVMNGSLTAYFNILLCWLSFFICCSLYRKHQNFKRVRHQRRHRLPGRHRR